MKLTLNSSAAYPEPQVRASIINLLEKSRLCSMATIAESPKGGESYINTAFYCCTPDLIFYVLTPPTTQHGQNLASNSSVALAIYDSHQIWDAPKQGLQLFGTAQLTNADQLREAMDIYLREYPGLKRWVQGPEEIEKLDSRFYRIEVSKIKIFDEPTFGSEVWIEVDIER